MVLKAEMENSVNNGTSFSMLSYMQVFDENNSVLHWDYNSEQLLFMLHDKIGNKWANIGQQLEGR